MVSFDRYYQLAVNLLTKKKKEVFGINHHQSIVQYLMMMNVMNTKKIMMHIRMIRMNQHMTDTMDRMPKMRWDIVTMI